MINQNKTARDPLPIVKIDATGGYGSGVADALLKRRRECRVIEYHASQRAYDSSKYPCLRDELWFNLARWLREGGTLQDDDKMHGDLSCPQYSLDTQGRQKVEAKAELKKRLGRSPDRADALALAVYSESNLASDNEDYVDYEPDEDGYFDNGGISPYGQEISPYGD